MRDSLKWQNCILILACVFLNLLGRNIANVLTMPFWLDAVGTLVAAIVLGPFPGAICGAMTNLTLGIFSNTHMAYAIVSMGIALSIGYYYPRNGRKANKFAVISAAVFAGVVAVILSTPLNMIYYNGKSGNAWGDSLIDMLSQDIKVPILCSIMGEAFVDIPDKALSVLIAVGIIKFFNIIREHRTVAKSGTLSLLIVSAVTMLVAVNGMDVKAADFDSDYTPVTYGTESGLATTEINAIVQTSDSYVWAGTYAGLYRCDGAKFEEVVVDERISNVMQLYVDSKQRLWIGTNDSGIFCYDIFSEHVDVYNMDSGLSSNSIRSITEDQDGNMYVGTATHLCVIHADGTINVMVQESLNATRSLTCNGEYVAGVTNAGELFFIQNEELLSKNMLGRESTYYSCAAPSDNGEFMVGTSDNYVLMVTPDGKNIRIGKKYTIDDREYFEKIVRSEGEGGYFYCCENGCGFISNEGRSTDLTIDDFNGSISDCIVDHQDNIWFSSNKEGIVRYSYNPFQDVFAKSDVPSEVVNCVTIKDGLLYIGTNSGLITIDMKTYYDVPIDHPELFEGVRVRDVMEDSKGNVWVSTYGKYGLIKLCEDGSYEVFNERIKGTEGGRFRQTLELSDGTIVACSNTGLNYIKDDEVIIAAGDDEGITTQILTMVETEDHSILAGTDGDGLYLIKDGNVVEHFTEDGNMDSQVIIKIVPCGEGDEYVYVTSNAIYYYKDSILTKLNNFPYKNNYDVFFSDNGEAWVSSSAGMYVVKTEDFLANTVYNYTLLNKSRGLYTSLTSNSKHGFDGEYLYLCCADGVRKVPIDMGEFYDDDYDIRISRLIVGNSEIAPKTDGTYVIPADSGRIQFDIAVLNFTLSNPTLHIFLEGANDDGIRCQQKEIQPLSYLNLPFGNYRLHVQVLDVSGSNVVQEEVFEVVKESQLYERIYFKFYLLFVCVLFVLFILWLVRNIRTNINDAEQWQKEAKIDPMTGFWNKIYSEEELKRLCEENTGILMMVDLDNFKLVNDLHGHDHGDKVLVKFAEYLKSCTRDEDFIGRVGGDEFIVFIQGTTEESAVAEKARYLNEEISKIGTMLIGESFSIPLGVSIGAVAVPDEGKDFAELYKKADKALYNVKQNGKHGYDLFRSTTHLHESEEVPATGLSGLRMILGERGENKGAYLVDFDKLQMVYRLFVRISKRTIVRIWIVQFMVSADDGSAVPDEIMNKFIDVITLNLRSNDVVAPNGKNKVVIIMTETDATRGQTPVDRIINKWADTPGVEGYTLSYETEDMA